MKHTTKNTEIDIEIEENGNWTVTLTLEDGQKMSTISSGLIKTSLDHLVWLKKPTEQEKQSIINLILKSFKVINA